MKEKFNLKTLLKSYAENATTHGIAVIYHTKWTVSKVIASLAFMTLFGLMIMSVVSTFYSFFEYKVFTNVKIKEYDKIAFPSITICRNNIASRSFMSEAFVAGILQKVEEIKKGHVSLSDVDEFKVNATFAMYMEMENSNKTASKHPPMILPNISNACLYASSVPCNITRDFGPTFPFGSLDQCYTFHGGEDILYYQRGGGPGFGLQLILYVNQSDYIPLVGTENGAGFTVYVHPLKTLPFMGINGISVAPGFYTKIALRLTETISKPYPHPTNCSNGEGILNYIPGDYSQLSCRMTCLFHSVYTKCGYTEPVIRGWFKHKTTPMTTLSMLHCRAAIMDAVLQGKVEPCLCPRACKEVAYEPVVSHSKWPVDMDLPIYKALTKYALGLNPENLTDDFIARNFLKIGIYYDEMYSKRYIEKGMMEMVDLASNIGGHLGFWTGSSVFSVMEWLGFLFALVSLLFTSKGRTGSSPQESSSKDEKKDRHGLEIEDFHSKVDF